MAKLVLVRHGQSLWNLQNRFTGWTDVPLTEKGREEAKFAGEVLKYSGIAFDVAYTSVLIRAIETLEIILQVLYTEIPVIRDAALNERFYGDLQGLNKDRTRKIYGKEIVHLWRRSYHIPPPHGESLEYTANRTVPFLKRAILQDVTGGRNVLVVAHGNSLRSIVMYLEKYSPEEIMNIEIPTGIPYVYEIDRNGKILSKKVLNRRFSKNS
jgi:2,3-bisphosphoglycerate-dependent phosphoglycerate mutase